MLNNNLSNVADLVKTRAGFHERLCEIRDPGMRQREDQLGPWALHVA